MAAAAKKSSGAELHEAAKARAALFAAKVEASMRMQQGDRQLHEQCFHNHHQNASFGTEKAAHQASGGSFWTGDQVEQSDTSQSEDESSSDAEVQRCNHLLPAASGIIKIVNHPDLVLSMCDAFMAKQQSLQKDYELEQLLEMQSKFKGELGKSSEMVQTSASDLAKMFAELEQTADVMTALAMFPIKNEGQKAAFVLGLGLVFKVLFDSIQLVGIRSGDFSDWFTVFTQTALALALWNHYGLIRAFINQIKHKEEL